MTGLAHDSLRVFVQLRARLRENLGSIVIISGESGIGKTHAVREFIAYCRERADVTLTAKGRPQARNPLYPIYEALADLLRTSRLTSHEIRGLFMEYALMLPRMAALIRPLLGEDAYLRGLEVTVPPSFSEEAAQSHCLDFIMRLANGRHAVFWIDDLQWADSDTLSFLVYACNQLKRAPILWLLCLNQRRPGIHAKEALDEALLYLRSYDADSVILLEPERYSRDELLDLVETMLGAPFRSSKAIMDDLYKKTSGVPFIVKVFLDVLRSERRMQLHDGVYWLTDPLGLPSLPDSLRSAIATRLGAAYSRVPEVRPVLETAAVIGERFAATDLEEILSLCNIYNLLGAMDSDHFLVRYLTERRLWEFDHVTIRDYIYDTLGDQAAQVHRKVATHLVASGSHDFARIAYHFKEAGNEEEALANQVMQADEWLRQGFFAGARGIFDDLWRLPLFKEMPLYRARALDLEHQRALAYFGVSEYETCLQLIAHLGTRFDGANLDHRLLLLKAKCLNKGNSPRAFSEACAILEDLRRQPEVKGNIDMAGRVAGELIVSYGHLNKYSAAKRLFEETERSSNPFLSPLATVQLMRRTCMFYEPALSEKILLRAAEVARRHHFDDELVRVLNNLATMYYDDGDMEAASLSLREAMTKSARIGGFGRDYILNNLSLVRMRFGDAETALTGLREAAACASRPVCRLIIMNNQAAALIQLGQTQAAHELLTRILPEALMTKEDIYIVGVQLNLALASLQKGRFAQALLELPYISVERIRAVGGNYVSGHGSILQAILNELGAVRKCPLRFGRPEPQDITMQFWGD